MDIVIALKRWRKGTPTASCRADHAPASDPAARNEEVRMLLALPAERQAAYVEIREAWVARLRAARMIRDPRSRRAEQRAAHEEFEDAKRDLFRRTGLGSS
jgi:hypothetical protein